MLGEPTPEYFYPDGFILLPEIAPIVTAADFPVGVPGAQILRDVVPSLKDPRLREAQIFAPNGLSATIRNVVPGEYPANQVAKKTALHAIRTHPIALGALAIHTWSEYFEVPWLAAYPETG